MLGSRSRQAPAPCSYGSKTSCSGRVKKASLIYELPNSSNFLSGSSLLTGTMNTKRLGHVLRGSFSMHRYAKKHPDGDCKVAEISLP